MISALALPITLFCHCHPRMAAAAAERTVEGVKLGEAIRVGSEAPSIVIPEEFGGPFNSANYRGKKDLVVIFYRGHW